MTTFFRLKMTAIRQTSSLVRLSRSACKVSLLLAISTSAAWAELTLKDAHVRAMPPGQPVTAAFLTLMNTGKQEIVLESASSDISHHSEFHSHTMDEKGVMRMREETQISIPAGQSFVFKPGHHHIMLMGLKKNLVVGDNVQLTLTDSSGQQHVFDLPVQSLHSVGQD